MKKYPGQIDLSVSDRESRVRAVARKAAAESMVLLENDGILPLKKNIKVAVIGPNADNMYNQLGGFPWSRGSPPPGSAL